MGSDWYSQLCLLVTYKTSPEGNVKKVWRGMDERLEYLSISQTVSNNEKSLHEVIERLIEEYKRENPDKMLYSDGKWLIQHEKKIQAAKRAMNENKDTEGFRSLYTDVEVNDDHIEMENVLSIQLIYGGAIKSI